jgi:hypothetical protein
MGAGWKAIETKNPAKRGIEADSIQGETNGSSFRRRRLSLFLESWLHIIF